MKKNAFYAQSGGVTSVINASASAVILEAKKSSKIGKVYAGKTCKAVGLGVLSRIVVFANKMFANIAGKSTQLKEDLVIIDSGMGDVSSFRNSWREGNF